MPSLRAFVFPSLLAAFLAIVGCGGTQPIIRATNPVGAEAHGVARVYVRSVDHNIFKFTVNNLSHEMFVVDRDAVVLRVFGDTRMRVAGGAGRTYMVQPGGSHDVNVKFDLTDVVPGVPMSVSFEHAINQGGNVMPVPPLEFIAE